MAPVNRAPTCVWFACFLLVAACGGEASSDSPTGGSGGTDGDAAQVDSGAPDVPGDVREEEAEVEAAVPHIHVGGRAVERDFTPIADLTVCAASRPEIECESTDSTGRFALEVPENDEIAVSLVKHAFGSVIVPMLTPDHDDTAWVIGMPAESDLATYYSQAGALWPDDQTGFLAVYVVDGSGAGIEGVRIAMDPSSGEGPLYDDPWGLPDMTADATSSWGAAHFANVAPGEVEVTTDPLGTPTFGGWPSMKDGGVRVPILAGFETHVAFYCTP